MADNTHKLSTDEMILQMREVYSKRSKNHCPFVMELYRIKDHLDRYEFNIYPYSVSKQKYTYKVGPTEDVTFGIIVIDKDNLSFIYNDQALNINTSIKRLENNMFERTYKYTEYHADLMLNSQNPQSKSARGIYMLNSQEVLNRYYNAEYQSAIRTFVPTTGKDVDTVKIVSTLDKELNDATGAKSQAIFKIYNNSTEPTYYKMGFTGGAILKAEISFDKTITSFDEQLNKIDTVNKTFGSQEICTSSPYYMEIVKRQDKLQNQYKDLSIHTESQYE